MSEYDIGKWSRELPYPLADTEFPEYSENNAGEVTQATPAFFNPDEPDEVIDIHFRMSMSQFTAIASAIDIGRDIGFGERSYELWRTWCKTLIGEITVACEDIADCIETSEVVQNAITTNQNIALSTLMQIANSGLQYPSVDALTDTVNTIPEAIGAGKTEDIKELEHCNLDKLWAGIREGIVQRLDDNARSVLEWLVSKADVAERGTALVGAIPIFGAMAKSLLDQMVELAPDMLNLYEAYSSIANMDNIACEIFGIVCGDCRYPTYQEVFEYYASAGITGFNDIDDIVIAAATDLLFGSTELAALAFYHTLIAYELLVLYMGSKFYGYSGTSAIVTMATLGEDFENDNWTVLCSTCNEPYRTWTWDFVTQGIGDWYPDTADASSPVDDGVFVSGQGWMLTNFSTGQRAELAMPIDPTWEIRAIAIELDGTTGAELTGRSFQLRPQAGSVTGQTLLTTNIGTGDYNICRDALASITNYREFAIALQYGNQTATRYVKKVAIIYNEGASPDGLQPTNDNTLCS